MMPPLLQQFNGYLQPISKNLDSIFLWSKSLNLSKGSSHGGWVVKAVALQYSKTAILLGPVVQIQNMLLLQTNTKVQFNLFIYWSVHNPLLWHKCLSIFSGSSTSWASTLYTRPKSSAFSICWALNTACWFGVHAVAWLHYNSLSST